MNLIQIVGLLLVTALLCVLCYFYVDRQVVWFLMSYHTQQYRVLKLFADGFVAVMLWFSFIYLCYFYLKLYRQTLTKFDRKLLMASVAVVVATFMKNSFKIVFARNWPETFFCNNPSLINNHVYGFHWFDRNMAFTSFPSGHTTIAFAFATAMWSLFPRFRLLWGLLPSLVAIGQVALYYHFVSDVIAGALLGTLVGLATCRYSQTT